MSHPQKQTDRQPQGEQEQVGAYVRPARKGPSGPPTDESRNREIIRLFLSGMTQPEIGALFNIRGTSVGRVLRTYGVRRSEGGKEVAARLRREAMDAAALIEYFDSLDCCPLDFESTEQFKAALLAFRRQRARAAQRGIGWELTFGEWWEIWTLSGRWSERGRSNSNSAVMSRRGDVGPYSKGNVYITTLAENFSESHHVRGHVARVFRAHDASVLFHVSEG